MKQSLAEAILRAQTAEASRLQNELETTRAALEAETAQCGEMSAAAAGLSPQLVELAASVTGLEAQLAAQEDELTGARDAAQVNHAACEQLRGELRDMEAIADKALTEAASVEESLALELEGVKAHLTVASVKPETAVGGCQTEWDDARELRETRGKLKLSHARAIKADEACQKATHECQELRSASEKAMAGATTAGETLIQAQLEARECQKLRVTEEKRKNKAVQRARAAEDSLTKANLELSHAKQQQGAAEAEMARLNRETRKREETAAKGRAALQGVREAVDELATVMRLPGAGKPSGSGGSSTVDLCGAVAARVKALKSCWGGACHEKEGILSAKDELTGQTADLKQQLKRVLQELDASSAECEAGEKALELSAGRAKELERLISEQGGAAAEVKRLSKDLEGVGSLLETTQGKLAAAREAVSEKDLEVEELRQAETQSSQMVETLVGELEAAQNAVLQAQSLMEEKASEARRALDDAKSARSQACRTKEELVGKDQLIQEAHLLASKAQADTEAAKREAGNLREKLRLARSGQLSSKELKSKVQKAEATVETIRGQHEELSQKLQRSLKEAKAAKEEVCRRKGEAREASEKAVGLGKDVSAAEGEGLRLASALAQAESTIEETIDRNESLAQELEDTLDALTAAQQDADRSRHAASRSLGEAESRWESAEAKVAEAERRRERECGELQRRLGEMGSTYEELFQRIEQEQESSRQLVAKAAALESCEHTLEKQNTALERQLEACAKAETAERTRAEEATADSEELQRALEAAYARHDRVLSDHEDITVQVASLQEEAAILRAKAEADEVSRQKAAAIRAKRDQEITRLRDQVKELKGETDQLRQGAAGETRRREVEGKAAKQKTTTLGQRVKKAEAGLATAEEKAAELEATIRELREECSQRGESERRASSRVEKGKGELREALEEISRLEADREKACGTMERSNQLVGELTERLHREQAGKDLLQLEIEAMRHDQDRKAPARQRERGRPERAGRSPQRRQAPHHVELNPLRAERPRVTSARRERASNSFDEIDANGDGVLDRQEYERSFHSKARRG